MPDVLARFVAEAQGAAAMFDREMRYLAASQQWLANRGLAACPVGRSHYDDLADFPEDWKAAHRRSLEGSVEISDDFPLPAPGGDVRWVRAITRPWRDDDGAVAGLVIVSEDVTDRVEAQRKADDLARRAVESERYLKEALDAIPGGFAIYDAEDRLRVINRAMRALYRFRDDDVLLGETFENLLHLVAGRGVYGAAVSDTEAFVAERMTWHRNPTAPIEIQVEDGRWLLGEERRTADGGTAVTRIDVTAFKAREQELARKTALLETTFRNMGEGIGVFDLDRRLMMAHDAVVRLLGAPPALVQPGALLEDVTRFRAERGDFGDVDVAALVAGRIAAFERRESWSVTARNPDGRVIDTRFNPTPGGGGVVMFSDVTERAAFEAELAERNELLEATFETMGEGIVVFGPDLRLRTFNRNAMQMFDMPPELNRPGTAFEDLTRTCALRGDYGDVDVEPFVRGLTAQFRAQTPWSRVRELTNGRLIDVRFRPMADGGGVYVYSDITERERAAARIREEEAKFRSLVEQQVAGIGFVREDGTVGYCNHYLAGLLQRSPEEIIGRPVLDFLTEAERSPAARDLREHFVHGTPIRMEATALGRDGRVVDVLAYASLSMFEGRPASVIVMIDVTARNRAQRDLASAAALLAAVQEASPDGILVVDPEARIVLANRRLGELLGIPGSLIAAGDGEAVLAAVAKAVRDGEAFDARVRSIFDGPDETVHDELTLGDGRVLDHMTSPFFGMDGERLGRIWFLRDISARREAEDALRASEERLRMVIEEAPDAILLYEPEGRRYIAANRAAERLFGISRDELIAHGPAPFYPSPQPDGLPVALSVAAASQRALAGEDVQMERRVRRRSGEERICRLSLARLPSRVPLLRVSLVDVTEQRAAEVSLRASERHFRMLIEEAPDAILLYDAGQERFVAANRAAEGLFGVPRDEILRTGPAPFYPAPQPDGAPPQQTFAAHLEQALAGEEIRFDRRIRRPSGEERVCHVALVRLSSKAPLLRASYVDVTEQRAAEALLRAEEERFRMLIEEAPDAILLYDADQNRYIKANRAAERLFGVSRDEILEYGPIPFYPLPQPDGLPVARSFGAYLERALAGDVVCFDRRIRRPSGEERLCEAALVRLPSKVRLIRTSFVDVTEQRAAEASLRAQEERFRMLIEAAPDAILLFDHDLDRFIAANRSAERLFDVPREDIIEHGPQHFYAPAQTDTRPLAQVFAERNRRVLAGEEVTFERGIRRPSGEERSVRITLVRLSPNANLIRASMLDVTEQRAAEAKLAEIQHDLLTRQETDRQRIARELHDSLGQYLAAVAIKIGVLDAMAAGDAPLRAGLADLRSLTGAVSEQVSNLAWELRPIVLDDIGLEAAARRLADEWGQRSGLRFDCHLKLDRRLPIEVETTLYRALQEGITNVVKHARAKTVGVIVKTSPRDVVMVIEDDGAGFDRGDLDRKPARLGLLGIRERLASLHGTLEVESSPGRGTTLIVRAPLPAEAPADSRPSG